MDWWLLIVSIILLSSSYHIKYLGEYLTELSVDNHLSESLKTITRGWVWHVFVGQHLHM